MVTDDQGRGQVILIGAITLAFIILGIVVVFNGVLYTETLSSGSSSQSATDATVTELEIEQGISCSINRTSPEAAKENIMDFATAYRNATGQSTPAAVNISIDNPDGIGTDNSTVVNATVIIEYDAHGISYEKERTIGADCPSRGS